MLLAVAGNAEGMQRTESGSRVALLLSVSTVYRSLARTVVVNVATCELRNETYGLY
jgi:hypothetical protein